MNIADPTYLEHLRDLPSGYLLDLLADNDDVDHDSLFWVLQERGILRDEAERRVRARQKSEWTRPHRLWTIARWLTIFNSLVVAYFNISRLYQISSGSHAFMGTLTLLSLGCILFGIFLGYKLATHLYQGGKATLYCGFPIPVGQVDLKTGNEIISSRKTMLLRISLNALIAINLIFFPLMLIFQVID